MSLEAKLFCEMNSYVNRFQSLMQNE